jgi:hypothetical protein
VKTDIRTRIDALYLARQARLDKQKEVDALKAAEDAEAVAIQAELHSRGIPELSGAVGSFTLKIKEEPEVVSWSDFQEHIRQTGELDLLQKRPMVSAIKARWEEGNDVPGVGRLEVETFTLGKAK